MDNIFVSAPSSLNFLSTIAEPTLPVTVQVGVSNNGVDMNGSWVDLILFRAPVVLEAIPQVGPVFGGTNVAVFGLGFMDSSDLSCAFGTSLVKAIYVNSGEILCQSPMLLEFDDRNNPRTDASEKSVALTASNNGIDFSELNLDFFYVPSTKISAISPRVLSLDDIKSGRAVVSVSGTRFVQFLKGKEARQSGTNGVATNITCRFTGIGDSVAIFVRSTMITCPLPAVEVSEGNLTLTVSVNGQNFPAADVGTTLTMTKGPRISYVSPASGPFSGGTTVYVSGHDFDAVNSFVCSFHFDSAIAIFVPARYDGQGLVSCTTPPLPSEESSTLPTTNVIRIAKLGVRLASASRHMETATVVKSNMTTLDFEYFSTPGVRDIYPKAGTTATLVDVVGEGFLDTASLLCRFGDVAVAPAAFTSTNVVTCRAPGQVNDHTVVAVEITNNLVDWTSNVVKFTYRPRAVVESVTPKVGPVDGNTVVRIVGSNFPTSGIGTTDNMRDPDAKVSCRFGSTLVSATSAVGSEIFCISPAATSPGSVNLEITKSGVNLTDSGWRFDYVPAIEVDGAYPAAGPEIGGTEVLVTGNTFLGLESMVCQFGSPGFRVAGRWLSHAAFACASPQQRPGTVKLYISSNGQQFSDSGLTFSYHPLATVTAVFPTTGSVRGGTTLTVRGASFMNNTRLACLVGRYLGEASYVNATLLNCRTPPADEEDGADSVAVRVANNGIDFTNDRGVLFEYLPPIEVRKIEPAVGSIAGGTKVRIHGTGFSRQGPINCAVGGVLVEALFETMEQLTCVFPPAKTPGPAKVDLTINGIERSASTASFYYHPTLEVTSVYPTSAPENGGSELLVRGEGFTDTATMSCLFNLSDPRRSTARESIAVYISDTTLSCVSPPGQVGGAELRVTNNGIDVSASWVLFTVTSTATVTTLQPSSGSVDGGTAVQVRGTGFVNLFTLLCKFGDEIVRADTLLDYTTVVCTSPARSHPGDVNVEVTCNGLDWTNSGIVFHYLPSMKITSVSPKIGPIRGGTVVRIDGSGLRAAKNGQLSCRFGAQIVTATASRAEGITCVAPESRLGVVPVDVSSNGADFTSNGWVFHYAPEIVVESASPVVGSESGGTEVEITGKGFEHTRDLTCEFGSIGTTTSARWIDSTTLSCTSPPRMPGSVTLRVSMNDQQFVNTGFVFEYIIESTVRAVNPTSGPSQGGTLVEVEGTAFINSTNLFCRLAGRRMPAAFVDSEHLRCITPPSVSLLSLPLEVSNNGVDFSRNGARFTFMPSLHIEEILPVIGPVSGGTNVVVHGSGFREARNNTLCAFGGVEVFAHVWSDSKLSCVTPHSSSSGQVPFEITTNVVDKVALPTNFTYVPAIQLAGVNPSQCGEEGGATVIVDGHDFLASPSLTCRFGEREAASATWLSPRRIACLVPSSPRGPREVSLAVSNNAQDFTIRSLPFTYVPSFTLFDRIPATGPVDGGTDITLAGTGLDDAGPWACVFGQHVAVPAIQLPGARLRCRAPPQPPGPALLRVFKSLSPLGSAVAGAIAAATTDSLQDFGISFEYHGNVFLSSIEPTSGSNAGGTPVVLRGFGFGNASKLTCGFGQQDGKILSSPAVHMSPGKAACSSPARLTSHTNTPLRNGRPFRVSVTVSLNGADFTSRGLQYTYVDPVEVIALFPATGPANGGTDISVVGRHFLPTKGLSCRFGASVTSKAQFVSSSELRCVSPPSSDGPTAAAVSVSNNLVEFSTTSAVFHYHPQARPARLYPAIGPLSGGTLVTVYGGAFTATPELACSFGAAVVNASFDSSTRIICHVPVSAIVGQVAVRVSANGVDWEDVRSTSSLGVFMYYQPPEADTLLPSTGPMTGGTLVSIFGHHLTPISSNTPVFCRVRCISASSQAVSAALSWQVSELDNLANTVTCQVPDLGAKDFATAEVTVSTDGGVHYSSPPLIFTYVQVRSKREWSPSSMDFDPLHE